MDSRLYAYQYRLAYQLTKEFKTTLLFRYGCPANGPCNYILVDKKTGREFQEFGALIYTSEDEPIDFIIYFTDNTLTNLTLQYINTNKKYKIKIPAERFNCINPVPEHQFEEILLKDNVLILKYQYKMKPDDEDWKIDKITIDLKKYAN